MLEPTDVTAEFSVLTTAEGQSLLAEVAETPAPRPADLARWRRRAPADWVSAALRLVEGRRKGTGKFSHAHEMWLDPVGAEQATAEAVARHKAQRFGSALVVDLCSGIGGDALALAERSHVVAVDRDRGRNRRLAWNARLYGIAGRILPVQARAETFAIPSAAFVHVDPDRRAGPASRGRAKAIADYIPGLDVLLNLTRTTRGGAIKLGPASDFAAMFTSPDVEIELTSLNGECKEATVWFGALASCRRRATALPSGATWTDRDGPTGPSAVGSIAAWLFDPDPALIRSGLLDSFALAHGLRRSAASVDLLTADDPIDSPLVTPFEVLESFPLDRKVLRRVVAERSLGPLEIKPRGLDIRPEELRADLRPVGPTPATFILIGGPNPARAFLVRRRSDSPRLRDGQSAT